MTRQRYMNLNIGLNTTGYLFNAWPHRSGSPEDITNPDYYEALTLLAHRGRFDAVFLSDHPALMTDPKGRPFHTLDPLILLGHLAAKVPDIGLVATISSTYNSPYNFARRTLSLDVTSKGRLVVNVVSSFSEDVAANFGAEPLPPREERYARAEEFLEVVKKLWLSWQPAKQAHLPEGRFWDPESAVTAPVYKGEYFTVKGALNVPASPQGYPLIAQAGGSDRGLDFAAQHGEMIYCNILSRPAGQAFRAKLLERAQKIGRDPASILLVPGLVPIVAESHEAALRLHEKLSGVQDEEGLLRQFAQENGIDFESLDPDALLDPADFVPDQNRKVAVGFTQGLVDMLSYERLSARQAVRRSAGNHRLVLGTAEQVADQIIDLWADGTVDGYTIQPPRAPDDIAIFVDQVIPILQERGVFRREYAGDTLRQRYGLAHPA